MLCTEARTLAGALRTVVNTSGTSLRRVGGSLDRGHSTLSQWINGQRLPSLVDLVALLEALATDEPTRVEVFSLHHKACGRQQPDYATVANYLVERSNQPASAVADVLEALARYVDATEGMCATTLDSDDLRAIAADCTD